MRAHADIQIAVTFLSTRVQFPDEDDWGKLKSVIKYLSRMRTLKLTLSAENLGMIQWCVDTSCTIHDYCKGHTSLILTLGSGAVTKFSRK